MHIGLIIDRERLEREGAMLHRLSQGLVDRDFAVTAILPEELPEEEPHEDQGVITADACVTTRMQVALWMRRARAHQLAAALESSRPDLLHAVGEHAWTVGIDLARVIDRPVMLDVWSAQLVGRAPHGRAAQRVAGYVCPTEPIAEALRRRIDPDLVSVVPLGVEVPRQPHAVLEKDEAVALAIIGSGHDTAAHRAMLTGLSRLTKELPYLQACLELRGPYGHEIWRHARRLDLLGHVSTIVDAARHRPLLTGCDVLVVPERQGQVRTLVLEAMALGMPVIASDDPYLDMLVADQTAMIVQEPDPDEWTEKLRRLLGDHALAKRLGATARSWIAAHHRPEDHLNQVVAAFEQVLRGGAHTFADVRI